MVCHEDQRDGDEDDGKDDVGFYPLVVVVEAHVLEPPARLDARQRQPTAQTQRRQTDRQTTAVARRAEAKVVIDAMEGEGVGRT